MSAFAALAGRNSGLPRHCQLGARIFLIDGMTYRPDSCWLSITPRATHPLHPWLTDRGSLTARLMARCTEFSVLPLRQNLAVANRDEAWLLQLPPHRLALVREVLLRCDGLPAVFAHSLIASDELRRTWRFVAQLGNRPLGAVLFANPRIQRQPLHYKSLDARHPLYRGAAEHLPHVPPRLWARRSLFTLNHAPLLVTEVFLPTVMELGK